MSALCCVTELLSWQSSNTARSLVTFKSESFPRWRRASSWALYPSDSMRKNNDGKEIVAFGIVLLNAVRRGFPSLGFGLQLWDVDKDAAPLSVLLYSTGRTVALSAPGNGHLVTKEVPSPPVEPGEWHSVFSYRCCSFDCHIVLLCKCDEQLGDILCAIFVLLSLFWKNLVYSFMGLKLCFDL